MSGELAKVKRRAKKLAEALGVTFEVDRGFRGCYEVLIDAPDGMCFYDGCHQWVSSSWDEETALDVWRDVVERLESAEVEKCDCGEC